MNHYFLSTVGVVSAFAALSKLPLPYRRATAPTARPHTKVVLTSPDVRVLVTC